MLPIKTILHPTDFSELSDAAFRVACSLAQDHGARLVVAHVYPPPASHGELVARRQDDDFEKELRRVLDRGTFARCPSIGSLRTPEKM
jgi:nucleotide-binding universal stress UspA family protein